MLPQPVMQILPDAPLLPPAHFQNRLLQPPSLGDIDSGSDHVARRPSRPGKIVLDQAMRLNPPFLVIQEVGICGEHGGDPDSIAFCNEVGLDYVSCSPFRVPVARLAAAQAALAQTERDKVELTPPGRWKRK